MTTRNIYAERLDAVRARLDAWEVAGVLISSPANRRWLSGFSGSAGQLLITPAKALLATDFRYYTQATQEAPTFELFKHQRRREDTVALFTAAGASRIGLESSHLPLKQAAQFAAAAPDVAWIPLDETLEPLRAVKSAAERAQIAAAAAITDQAMAQVNDLARPGMSERALAWELEKRLREAGAHSLAFPVIVASGPNSALPHHRPSERLLQAGDAIIVDMGATLNGYHSDLTRTFYLGSEPDGRFWEIYNLVSQAHAAPLAQMRPGMSAQAADALARDLINAAGHAEQFGHGLGHGVGLEVHEAPPLSQREESARVALTAGMVITVEPGIYIPGWGGVRIEDLIYLTESGPALLSLCPQTPLIPL